LAVKLIEQLSGDFEPDKYHDTYTGQLMQVIEQKAHGQLAEKKITPPKFERIPDLMESLKKSLEMAGSGSKSKK